MVRFAVMPAVDRELLANRIVENLLAYQVIIRFPILATLQIITLIALMSVCAKDEHVNTPQ